MGSRLRDEIKQTKPFSSLEQEALLNLQRTAGFLQHAMQQMLRPHGLTEPQYNVLRILRGAGTDGLRCSEIGERMVSRDPDITRLLERLERQHLIERKRDSKDRRVVYTHITDDGLQILSNLDPVIEESSRLTVSHLGAERLTQLIDLLEDIRNGSPALSVCREIDKANGNRCCPGGDAAPVGSDPNGALSRFD